MEKTKFEKFINKYNLNGTCESVLYKVEGDSLFTRAISDDKNVLCEVVATHLASGLQAGQYAVYDTNRLRSILGVLDDSLTVSVKQNNSTFTGIVFSDHRTEATFVLADTSVIPVVPELKKLPPFDITIEMDEKFISTFVKAKGALSEVDTFAVMSDGTDATAQVVIGFSSMNTNRIKLSAKTNKAAELKPINFSAKYLREILVANKDAKYGKLEVSSKGLARTMFEVDGVISTYYLVQIDTKD
jgi:hypothetical protein